MHILFLIPAWLFFSYLPISLVAADLPFDNSRLVSIDNQLIHYRHWNHPEGTHLGSCLLVHGYGASTYSWELVADSLHKLGYEVVALDMPPFGYSDKSPNLNQSITSYSRRLHLFVEELFPGKQWHLAGHSMGGAVVQAYALQYPESLHSVSFVAPTLFATTHQADRLVRYILRLSPMRFVLGELAEEWLLTPRRVESLLESAYGMPPSEEQIEAYLKPLRLPGTARAILSAGVFHEELAELDAAMLVVPAIAIWGDSDTWITVESRRAAIERIPGLELVLMEGVGHNPMETHPDEFMRAWFPFLKEHAE